jgi:hypothetical protein
VLWCGSSVLGEQSVVYGALGWCEIGTYRHN